MALVERLLFLLQNWADVISGIGSVLLTFGLVLLYFRQNQIQRTQTRILEQQSKPIIEIGEPAIGEDTLSVTLSNSGSGPANNIKGSCLNAVIPSLSRNLRYS